jgi:hypothetical protein
LESQHLEEGEGDGRITLRWTLDEWVTKMEGGWVTQTQGGVQWQGLIIIIIIIIIIVPPVSAVKRFVSELVTLLHSPLVILLDNL